MKKWIISSLLVLCLMLFIIPQSAEASEIIASGDCGSYGSPITWELTKDGTITFSGKGAISSTYSYERWREHIQKAVFSEGITEISYTFWGCTNLSSVTLPDTVTTIGSQTFWGCTNLADITIPNSVTKISHAAFQDCTKLNNVIIPDSVTHIDNSAFKGCKNLSNIVIPDSVTNIGYNAFQDCISLSNIHLPDSLTSIAGYAFDGCIKLSSIIIPDSVTYLGDHIFQNCTNLASVTLSNALTTIHSEAFSGCTKLANITIPDSVTQIAQCAFKGCTSLKKVIISPYTSIGASAFSDCVNLVYVKLPYSLSSQDTWYYREIGEYAFSGCTNLIEIEIPKTVDKLYGNAFRDCVSLQKIMIPACVEEIDGHAFYGCTNLKLLQFEGDKPNFTYGGTKLFQCDPIICFPAGNSTWSEYDGKNGYISYISGQDHVHNFIEEEIYQVATCLETGIMKYSCKYCIGTYFDIIPKAHTEIIQPGKAVTCTEDGLTEGKYCSTCSTVLKSQETIPSTGHSYGLPVYTWNKDYCCSADFICSFCQDKQTKECSVVSTPIEDGTLYIATVDFGGKSYFDTKSISNTPILLWGDVNDDGKANFKDSVLILQYASGRVDAEQLNLGVADVNSDNKYNFKDAVLILQYASGRIDSFPE